MLTTSLHNFKFSLARLLSAVSLLFTSLLLHAQNDSIPKFYKDSTGNFFIAPGTPVYLYIGASPDGTKSVKLKGENGIETLHWNGHGLKRLTHINLFSGQQVILNLFADALPPRTSIGFESGKDVLKDDIAYLSGQCIIDLEATDPDAGLKEIFYSINSGAKTKYSKPFALNGEGSYKLTVFALDNVGNKEDVITRTIVVDNTPPQSLLDIVGDKFENTVSERSSFAISSTDALGVSKTFYCFDGTKMLLYSKPIRLSGLREGEHSISWYSVDDVDNVEASKSFAFYLDKTPPMVFEEVAGSTYMVAGKEFSSGRSQLKIAAVDNKAGVKEINYSLNQAEFKVYDKPVYLSEILGAISVRSYAIDNVNNRSMSNTQSEVFTMPTVDITGPQIFYSFVGPKIVLKDTTWIGPKTKIQISTNDIGSGVNRTSYNEKGGEEKTFSDPFSFEGKGYHEVVCTSFDNVDNVNLISFGFGIDNQAPSVFYHFSIEPTGWLNEKEERIPIFSKGLKIFLAATDNLSGVDKLSYTLNNYETQYTSPIAGFKPATTYALQIRSTDVLGNSSEQTVKFRVE